MSAAGSLVAGYLLGSLSFSYIVVWLLRRQDIRLLGSRNAGATNVLRVAGPGPATVALALDVGKGAAAVLWAKHAGHPPWTLSATALAVVVGHVWPLFLGFRGGKGVATSAGAMAVLAPAAVLLAAAAFCLAVLATRYVSLGSIVGVALMPLAVGAGGLFGWRPPGIGWILAASVATGALVLWRHRDNLGRLRAGTEPRIGQGAELEH